MIECEILMAEALEFTRFAALMNEHFEVGDTGIVLQLVECSRLKSFPGEPREPFSLVFQGPQTPLLPQKTYPLRNSQLGMVEIFLVPIRSVADGFQYEAVFN